jgi:hypothetical protein
MVESSGGDMNRTSFSILVMNLGWLVVVISIVFTFLLDAGDPNCQVVPPDLEVFLESDNEKI